MKRVWFPALPGPRAVPIALCSLVVAAALAPVAAAHPPPPPDPPEIDWRDTPATFEWSTWFRLGFGMRAEPSTTIARTIEPQPPSSDRSSTWETGLGADVSVTLSRRTRLGAWAELQGLEPAGGLELVLARSPSDLDLFMYRGEGVWMVRGGGSATHATAAIAWGYRCPWKLWGPYNRTTRYEIGARVVLSAARAYADPNDWSATLGIEVEPVGALRYLLGIRSWY